MLSFEEIKKIKNELKSIGLVENNVITLNIKGLKERHLNDLILFDCFIFALPRQNDEKMASKVWFGDINLTLLFKQLEELAEALKVDFYIVKSKSMMNVASWEFLEDYSIWSTKDGLSKKYSIAFDKENLKVK